ncbi:cation diffusion facilitator family transporter [Vibrio sp. WXL103]|uniref:cation diffusion facilitator family transporter n=1 Tax=unclassified Vibrio TaxID=2614977 RepID=UPI003EC4DE58
MTQSNSQLETRILKFSAFLSLSFAVLGVVLGWYVGSLVIIFDGAYSLISLLLTLLSLLVAAYIAKPAVNAFPFGKAALEPLVIAVKGAVILGLVVTSLYSAVISLLEGGRDVDTGTAFIFGVINVIGCAIGWWYVSKHARRCKSGLIEAEAKQWKMDTLISLAVAVGFITAFVLNHTPLARFAGLADPIMMLIMGFYFLKVPSEMLLNAFREMLMMAPRKEVTVKVMREVNLINRDLESNIRVVAVTKVGNELMVKLNVHSVDNALNVKELTRTRAHLTERLSVLPMKLNLILNVAC